MTCIFKNLCFIAHPQFLYIVCVMVFVRVTKFGGNAKMMQVVTGLLIAEVNVKTMCELGSGGVSLVISLIISTL